MYHYDDKGHKHPHYIGVSSELRVPSTLSLEAGWIGRVTLNVVAKRRNLILPGIELGPFSQLVVSSLIRILKLVGLVLRDGGWAWG
jgi:hypothetical protein